MQTNLSELECAGAFCLHVFGIGPLLRGSNPQSLNQISLKFQRVMIQQHWKVFAGDGETPIEVPPGLRNWSILIPTNNYEQTTC